MKKNTAEKDVELRTAILDQATKLFKIFGYNKLVLEDIARAVGKSRSTLYLYYKDKEAIFNAIIEREIQAYLAVLTQDLPNHTTAVAQLEAYFQIKFDFRYAKATEYLTLNKEMTRQPELLARMRVFSDPTELAHLTTIIRFGITNGEFEPFSEQQITLLANLLISALHGISNDVLADVETANIKPVRAMLSTLFVRSLERHPAR